MLRLDVETINGVPGEDISRCPQSDDVGVVREDLEGDGIAVLAVVILMDIKLKELGVG